MSAGAKDAGVATELKPLAEQAVEMARRAGATDAEAVAFEGDEFSVHVRMGEVDELTESGSRAIGLRVFFEAEGGQRTASTSTSDLSQDGIARLVSGAVELAKVTGVDPFAGSAGARGVWVAGGRMNWRCTSRISTAFRRRSGLRLRSVARPRRWRSIRGFRTAGERGST